VELVFDIECQGQRVNTFNTSWQSATTWPIAGTSHRTEKWLREAQILYCSYAGDT